MKLNHIHSHTKFVTFGFQNKLHSNNNNNNKHKSRGVSSPRISTKTLNKNSLSCSSQDSLLHRIQAVPDPKASILPILREWVTQGRDFSRTEIAYIVRTLRGFKRFHQALQISLWMSDKMYSRISPGDAAIRLDLIHRVHGLECAENYFNTMSQNLKKHSVYGSLLRSYVRENRVEKAEALMMEIRKMGPKDLSSFTYNMLIGLYAKSGDVDKIENLMREMETKGIPNDRYTLRNRMLACISVNDVRGMENMLSLLEKDRKPFIRWKVYSLAASGYIKFNLNEKAFETLQKFEKDFRKLRPELRKTAFVFLLTLYAKIGDRDKLFRVWESYKPSKGKIDAAYGCMIRSLAKLNDIDGAERVFEEWESKCKVYEFRVVNCILVAYCKKGLLDKAEMTLERAINGGTRAPYTSTWNILARGFVECNNLPKAVESLRKGLLVGRKNWMPSLTTLSACLHYLKDKRDVEGMEEMISLVKNLDVLSVDTCNRLLRACYEPGESFSEVLCQSENDFDSGIEANENGVDGFSSDDDLVV